MKIAGGLHRFAPFTECACNGCRFVDVFPKMPSMTPPDANSIGKDRELWTLDCNYLGPLIDGKATLILRGFKTDGISIPRAAWSVIGNPFSMPMLAYALPHDADYAAELMTQAQADGRFLQGMADDGRIGWAKRNAVWTAVRAFGWSVFGKHTKESIEDARKYCRLVEEKEYWTLVSEKHLRLS